MRVDEYCSASCMVGPLSEEVAAAFRAKIDDEYRVNMILDNLPVAQARMREEPHGAVKTYERGYPVGFKVQRDGESKGGEDAEYYVNNHLRFTVLYHEDADVALARVVGFEVEPFSVRHKRASSLQAFNPADPALRTCDEERRDQALPADAPPQPVAAGEELYFTHDMVYRASDIRWASRWDTYLLMTDTQIHWFSIVNSLVIVLFLSGMVALIMMRTLHADIAAYNAPAGDGPDADSAEESGWKLVHGDVLRPPNAYGMLAVAVGSGVQVLGMTVITMFFALLGFLSPANRGALMTAMLLLFSLCGAVAGYVSSRMYRGLFRGAGSRLHTLRTALTFPGVVFAVFCVLNALIWGQRSSGAVPFGTFFVLCFLWFGVSVPLVFVGAYFGARADVAPDPVRTNKIPRQVPEQPWYLSAPVTILVGGILPFGAVFIELFFILTSMWLHQFYYVFGFLLVVLLILAVTCAEIAVVLVRARVMDIAPCVRVLTCVRCPFCRCRRTSSCAARTITGGGAPSSPPGPAPSTSSSTPHSTLPQSWTSPSRCQPRSTSGTCSSSPTPSSWSRAPSASWPACGSCAQSTAASRLIEEHVQRVQRALRGRARSRDGEWRCGCWELGWAPPRARRRVTHTLWGHGGAAAACLGAPQREGRSLSDSRSRCNQKA
jgi:transmembrane 9 superfamily protein 2/4